MKRTYEYRLYTRQRERQALDMLLEQHREVYNAALQQCKNGLAMTGKHQRALKQWAYFRDWRNSFSDLLLNASSLQHTLRRLDKAFEGFFRRLKAGETAGYPRFKGKERLKSIEYTYGDGCRLEYDAAFDRYVLYIQHVGNIKIKFHRALPSGSEIQHVVLKRKATGWYVFLQLALPQRQLPLPLFNCQPQVGGDMGLLRLLSLSDGTLIDNPRWLRHALDELRRAQQRLSRRMKGGKRRKKAALLVAKLHEHVANQRRDFWHKLTTWLVHTYGLIALENLSLDFMLRNGRLSLSAHDAGLGLFQQFLDSKAVEAGCGCGEIVEKPLSVRVHECPNPNCLLILDRDVNAAINILNLALQVGLDQAVRPIDPHRTLVA
jgi:putative transposase